MINRTPQERADRMIEIIANCLIDILDRVPMSLPEIQERTAAIVIKKIHEREGGKISRTALKLRMYRSTLRDQLKVILGGKS